MSGFVAAVAFLTRIPVRAEIGEPDDLARSVPWFPVVGLGVGIVVALAFAGASFLVPTMVAATVAVATGILLTGAFHEDGLADVADAFGGGSTRAERLAMLDDPRHGTFGVLALGIALLMRVGAIAAFDPWTALAVIPAAHCISRAAAIAVMASAPLAAPQGLGAAHAGSLRRDRAAVGIVSGVAACALLIGLWAIVAVAACAVVAWAMRAVSMSKIGGVGGDVLGAAQQIAEIAVLASAAAAVHGAWVPMAWWRP